MCWVQCVLQDAGIVASGRRSIGSMNERQNISEFVSLVLHLAVGAHSILELRCRFHIGEREAFASSISSKLWSCGLRQAQVTHHNLLHIWEQNGALRYAMCFVILIIYCCVMTK